MKFGFYIMKYNILIGIYSILIFLVCVLPLPLNIIILLCIILTIIIIGVSAWGASNISSGLYVKTTNKFENTDGKIVLTFDDGPDKNTPEILELLEKYNAKASFFIIGEKAIANKEIIEEIYKKGHLIGNHSYNHKWKFPLQKVKDIKEEISKTQQIISDITNEDCKYFRPPFGVTNPLISMALRSFHFNVIGWNIRSLDTVKTKEEALNNVISNIKSGDIVLLHDTTKDIIWILEEVFKILKERQLKAVRIDELM